MTSTARKALMLGLGLIASTDFHEMYKHDYEDSLTPSRSTKPRVRAKTQLTPKQKKARNKSKQSRKARRK